MSDSDLESLQAHRAQRGFRFRYSITNYVEMLSRLGRGPTPKLPNPFGRIRAAFRRIQRLCEPEVLPSPEMSFLEQVGLSHYLSPTWIPNPEQTAMAVTVIADAGDNVQSIVPWFQHVAKFFLLFRPSSGQTHYEELSSDEKNRFGEGLTCGAGRVFQAHLTLTALNTINHQHRIDPNDLYDAMQLLLFNGNRIFVSNDADFFHYTVDATIHHVVPWEPFRQSPV